MASPTLTRTLREPAVVTPGRSTRVRRRVQAQWLVLAAALTVLAGTLVAWGLQRAADRVEVVSIAAPVEAGTVLDLADLTTTAVAIDADVQGLVPATSLERLVGRVATIDLQPGTLLTVGMWADGTTLAAGERTVGAVLPAGRFPQGLAQGSAVLALAVEGDTPSVAVRVIDAEPTDAGELAVTLAVADVDATRIAQLAATETLVLVGLPPTGSGGTAP